MIRQKKKQMIYTQNPRLVGCNGKGNFHGLHVFIPPHSRTYVTNQSYTTGAPRLREDTTQLDPPTQKKEEFCEYATSLNPTAILSIHPSIAKAWTTFSGVTGEVYEGFNIMSVHKKDIGSYQISLIIPMSNTNYVPVVMAEGFNVQASPVSLRTHAIDIETKRIEENAKLTPYDSHTIHLVIFGSLHSSCM